jgi:hypothetical protein
MEPLKKLLCLYATSSDLKFLNPVKNRLAKVLGPQSKVYELNQPSSNAKALNALNAATEGFVVIFAHGSGDYILSGEYRNNAGEYSEAKFITRQNLKSFSGKVVFCMSCDSNEMADACIAAGVVAFVGFDGIPFNRFDANGDAVGSHVLVKHCQEILIAPAITAALERFLDGRASLNEAVDYLRLWITKRAAEYVRDFPTVKERRESAALFLRLKDGVRYHGPLGVRFAKRL